MPGHPLEDVLLAGGPAVGLRRELMLFGQFEGSWDLVVRWFADGNVTREEQGEWHFGWILDGRAMQDVWIVPSREAQKSGADAYEYGTSVRFFDPGISAWRSTWIGPVQHSLRPFLARAVGEEIILAGQQLDGRDIEWIFSDISADRFSWRFQKRLPSGGGWEVVQAFECTRRR